MTLFDVYPLNNISITKAKGSYVWDEEGVQYLDMYGGHAVISIGHTHPHWVKRIEDQLEKIAFILIHYHPYPAGTGYQTWQIKW
jgi:acetylornithine/N-succinyldiaminopimelate aminotransferase